MLTSFIFCARTLLLGQIDMLLLMTSETFPTTVRGTAVGVQASTFYLGFFLTPYISACFCQQNKLQLEIKLQLLFKQYTSVKGFPEFRAGVLGRFLLRHFINCCDCIGLADLGDEMPRTSDDRCI
ncbi:hypothetical protein TNCT_577753 [Trichonephila clavata]|uniref:Uncharacterized protein n=1 Tax=Trichonephila clavata TaxID=2740835 RepID=A0A8X6L3J4_TRICU|nr:hypothetical protein TNCT_577753 [Trichonephila clavata]